MQLRQIPQQKNNFLIEFKALKPGYSPGFFVEKNWVILRP